MHAPAALTALALVLSKSSLLVLAQVDGLDATAGVDEPDSGDAGATGLQTDGGDEGASVVFFPADPNGPNAAGLGPPFDPDLVTGNAYASVVIPYWFPILPFIALNGGDASLVVHFTNLQNLVAFDAVAPYHPTAVGVYSRLPRQPTPDLFAGPQPVPDPTSTKSNLQPNIALLYAEYTLLQDILPQFDTRWRQMMTSVGLDPDDESVCAPDALDCSPIEIGNGAARAALAGREDAGFNYKGFAMRTYSPQPFEDYTGYEPVNTAYTLTDASRWQPAAQRQRFGVYKIQEFVTPQWELTEPFAPGSPELISFPPPTASDASDKVAYKAQADDVLAAISALTPLQKAYAEFYDNKIDSYGVGLGAANRNASTTVLEFIYSLFTESASAHDAGIAIWAGKRHYDAVRPFSAIRSIYGDAPVTSWGGPGVGTVDDMPAADFQSYIPVADHPEYPSASACLCAAVAQSQRNFFGTDDLINAVLPVPAGSSRIELGMPEEDLLLEFPTWTSWETECAASRVYAGLHFQFAVDVAPRCSKIGDAAYEWVQRLIAGTEPVRPPSKGRPVSDIGWLY